ncbi:NAD-dependent epimerase/dehydratase family protein [Microbaculum marinisediminis]|uniref:NAD(P)-dependent oxidoreductase n=1 Tax=Microbaculum marinisediminis TaxID=2931392 RepID=A0AAW5QZR3_9HYPH|nr:NAD(P)-dependent oxidoreductase [Microbaculum sp. A6E488]MCT8973521.1 NAD(P)-dependent oxidoreductase [Microbaculum sp. A6E488]
MGKLLVTGGMGHVGYETVRQAAAAGIEVVAQYMTTFREADAEAAGPNVTWAQCDLSDPYELTVLAAAHDISGCIHTAAVPNDKLGYPRPLRTFQSNVVATELLLETARRLGWRRFLFVSTGSVFQSLPDAVTPVAEDTNPTPRSLYAATKRSAELMTAVYADTYGLSAATVRISWIFGPPLVPRAFDGPRGPIPEYLRRAMRGEAIRAPSGGDFAASFTFVPDCAAGLLTLWQAEALRHREYHLGSGRNHTTYEVAEAVRRAVPGVEIEVGPGSAPWTDTTVMRGPLDCSRMVEEFGFRPEHSLDEAVAAFADWMRANPDTWGDAA